MKTVLI